MSSDHHYFLTLNYDIYIEEYNNHIFYDIYIEECTYSQPLTFTIL